MLNIISLGAGVQSTTMALMAAHRELKPMPDAAIFADTGAEPKAVYEHLRWLRSDNVLPFPVHVVQYRNLKEDLLLTAEGKAVGTREDGRVAPPFHAVNPDGSTTILRRECTQNYKIDPIRKEVKRLLGRDPDKPIMTKKGAGPLVRQWIGISVDEIMRKKPSRVRWVEHWHPLIDLEWTRGHCLEWIVANGYPVPPRSACTFCPYLSNDEWRRLKESPDDWNEAVEVDELIRTFPARKLAGLTKGGELFVHPSKRPLSEVDLTDPHKYQISLFDDECEGMCGV